MFDVKVKVHSDKLMNLLETCKCLTLPYFEIVRAEAVSLLVNIWGGISGFGKPFWLQLRYIMKIIKFGVRGGFYSLIYSGIK